MMRRFVGKFKMEKITILDVDAEKKNHEKCSSTDVLFKSYAGAQLGVRYVNQPQRYYLLNMMGNQVHEEQNCSENVFVFAYLVVCKSVRRAASSEDDRQPTWTELARSINGTLEGSYTAWQHNMTIAGVTCSYLFLVGPEYSNDLEDRKWICAINGSDIINICNRYDCGFLRSKISEYLGL